MENKITLRQKLALLRSHMAGLELNKSGHNKHANFMYYELGDFLPDALKKMAELKMLGVTDFVSSDKYVFLNILDCEDDNTLPIQFATEKTDVEIQGAKRIQNIGGEHTYQRRYLWMDALEISEPDSLDATTGKKTQKTDNSETTGEVNPESKWINKQDEQKILALATVAEIEAAVKKFFDDGRYIGGDRIKRIEARKAELKAATQTTPPPETTEHKDEDTLYVTLGQLKEMLATTDPVLLKDKKAKLVAQGAKFTKIMADQLLAHFEKISTKPKPKDDLDELFDSTKTKAEALAENTATDEQINELDKLL